MALYDHDFYTWTQEQADLLRRRAANQIDWEALAANPPTGWRRSIAGHRDRGKRQFA